MREGLLPDHLGKEDMEKPTKKDWAIVNKHAEPLSGVRLRDWEDGLTTAENLNLKE